MHKVYFAIFLVTTLLFVHLVLLTIPDLLGVGLVIFGCSPLLVLWMVYRILKYGVPSAYTTDDTYYEDYFISSHST